ncbi:MAG TPA: fumarylacetoacetate hydrolase family protein [Spirochaetia bacterium]|nr:fumarylacetoacetate hydrolase family protein [Spirochaetales bacterium]HRY81588.1 fumarylacetoacetate hydrolase family protein [Spirochaetia bacterium]HRZ90489.1 fumarylacetoacetate hydrolase family protein [Spirochaetia bacterium]
MKIAMYTRNGVRGIAVLSAEGPRGLEEGGPGWPGDLDTLISGGADLRDVGARLSSAPLLDAGTISYLPPLVRPSKILCIGLNYRDHSSETGLKLPDYPAVFARFPSCLVGHGQPLVKPAVSDQFDYEGELVAVIGRRVRKVSREEAPDFVAGYSAFNEASVRDFQMRTSQWTVGKNFDGTGAFGPWLVTPEELPPGARGVRIRTRLNGQTVQDGNTSDMVFDVADLVSILSRTMTLEPGDVLVTGTPSGVGMARKPPLFMKPGDVCEVEIEGIGILRNPVIEG